VAAIKTNPVKIVEVAIPAIPRRNGNKATTTAPLPLCNFGGKIAEVRVAPQLPYLETFAKVWLFSLKKQPATESAKASKLGNRSHFIG
jgi:hypothetical protein